MSFFLHDILGLGDGDERKAASRRRGSPPNAPSAPRTKAATTASSAVGRAVPRDVRTTPRTAPTPPSPPRDHTMGLPPPPPPIAVKKTPPASPARPPVRPSPGQEVVDAIRDALVRRRRSNNDTSSAHRRIEPETRDDRPKDFPPSHTPGGTSARRVFTGVRDLLEDLRAAVDDAELMEQQRGGPDATLLIPRSRTRRGNPSPGCKHVRAGLVRPRRVPRPVPTRGPVPGARRRGRAAVRHANLPARRKRGRGGGGGVSVAGQGLPRGSEGA